MLRLYVIVIVVLFVNDLLYACRIKTLKYKLYKLVVVFIVIRLVYGILTTVNVICKYIKQKKYNVPWK